MRLIRMTTILILGSAVLAMALLVAFVTQPVIVLDSTASNTVVSPERLKAHVRKLSEELAPRSYADTANLDRIAVYIGAEFAAAKGRVSEQPYTANGNTYRNVRALFGPAGGPRVVIGAHYDACQPLPGADDNASAVAGLIELAHLLGAAKLAVQVELVAFTLEEPPFFRSDAMGSAVHAAALKAEGVGVKAMINLEMIGYFSDQPGSQAFPHAAMSWIYPARGDFIAIVGNLDNIRLTRAVKHAMAADRGIPVRSITAPDWIPGIDYSDHLNYWKHGYPAVMITDTSFYRNKNYHTAADTWDTLDYARMSQVVRAVFRATLGLAAAR
jgi:hypothetical protein